MTTTDFVMLYNEDNSKLDEMQARAEMLYEHQKEQEYLNNKENQS